MYKVLVVDDHPIFRKGLCSALRKTGRWHPVEAVATAEEALFALEREPWSLLVLDLNLSENDGFKVLEAIQGKTGNPAIFVFTMHRERSYIEKAIALGALGYASKNIDFSALERGMQAVVTGNVFFEKDVFNELAFVQNIFKIDEKCAALLEELAPRERELFARLLKGLSLKEAATELAVSVRTVENYQTAIYAKLGATSPVHLVTIALRAGCPTLRSYILEASRPSFFSESGE